MVEAAGIEKASTLTKLGTYSRNRCLKSASWTFALRRRTALAEANTSLLSVTRIVLQEFLKSVERFLREPFEGIVFRDDLKSSVVVSYAYVAQQVALRAIVQPVLIYTPFYSYSYRHRALIDAQEQIRY